MADTYCGKSCDECKFREELNCPGCKAGPGAPYYGDCELAKCCREKGHDSCDTCTDHTYCVTLKNRRNIPTERMERLAAEAEQHARNAARAPFLGKWLTLLFWLIIPSITASVLNSLSNVIPPLALPSAVLSIASSVAYGVILLILSRENGHYLPAGICSLIGTVMSLMGDVVFADSILISLVTSVAASALAIASVYHEFTAHSEILAAIDGELSEKWDKLLRRYILAYALTIGSVVLILALSIIGALIAFAAIITLVVVSICKLVYLYRTAQMFREYK